MDTDNTNSQQKTASKRPSNSAKNSEMPRESIDEPQDSLMDNPPPQSSFPPPPTDYQSQPPHDQIQYEPPLSPNPSSGRRKRAYSADSLHSDDEQRTENGGNSQRWTSHLGNKPNQYAPIFIRGQTIHYTDNTDIAMDGRANYAKIAAQPKPSKNTGPASQQSQAGAPTGRQPPPPPPPQQKATSKAKDAERTNNDTGRIHDTARDHTNAESTPPANSAPATGTPNTATGDISNSTTGGNSNPATSAQPKPAKESQPNIPPTKRPSGLDQLLDDDEEDDAQPQAKAAQHDDDLDFTPTPDDGWPRIFYTGVKSPFKNIVQAQLGRWRDEITGGKCIVQIMYASSGKDDETKRVNQIKEILDRTMGLRKVKVAPPTPKIPHGQAKGHPFSYLLWGISLQTAEKLVHQRCITTKIAGLIFLPFDVAYPAYLGSLDHLQARDNDDLAKLGKDIIALWKDPKKNGVLKTITETVSETEGDIIDPNAPAIAHTIIDTLELKALTIPPRNGAPARYIVNLYIDPNTSIEKKWQAIRQAVAEVTYTTALYGKGAYFEGWGSCHACHGEDHPLQICPFREIEGWIQSMPDRKAAQKSEDATNTETYNNQRFRGRKIDTRRPLGADGRRGAPHRRLG